VKLDLERRIALLERHAQTRNSCARALLLVEHEDLSIGAQAQTGRVGSQPLHGRARR